ncbi:uncharacterized protein LOC116309071 [Actinia tenebrosa]|uniref:Uncharacterized protein LOC116309071 n=1 Tax=Actinia tenebrosa TaxID=6105 RepID=A0A6P8JD53_ACTTE|nr:uncharacterized protein LOC116309071 [Actinia tenebrosa]
MKNYFETPVVARWVEIMFKSYYGKPCMRFELYGSRGEVNKNVALFKPTEQSSSGSHHSSKAVDGILTATIGEGSCSTTQLENNPWWRVDLEHEYLIKSVSIKNNEDKCCYGRLSDLTVKISVNLKTNFTCASNISLTVAGEHKKVVCEQMRQGRYVEIVNSLRTVLTLCEVEVEAYVSAELRKDPVGLESGLVKNESITASSVLGDGYLPHHGRFNTIIGSGGWCALNNNPNTEYLQIDLEVRYTVKAVYTQGLASGCLPASAQVLTYSLSYSDNGINWAHVMQGSDTKVLPKGSYFFGTEILGRYFRFNPMTWKIHICMRVEMIGQRTYSSPLYRSIPNYALKESSWTTYTAQRSQLFSFGWRTFADKDQFLLINVVPGPKHVTGIVTMADIGGRSVKQYSLSYSYNGINWLDYMENGKVKVFSGVSVKYLSASHNLKRRVMALLLKILVLGVQIEVGLTVELYGCKVCDEQPLGMEDGSIQDSSITASSWKSGLEPYKGRFNGGTGWCANSRSAGEYMQVDFKRVMTISAITMQIVERTLLGWPYSFTLGYSYDGRVFRNYKTQDGKEKTFGFGSIQRPQLKFYLERFVEARKFRVYVKKFYNHLCMRFELHGYKKECFGPVELSLNDAKRLMKASSYLGLGFEPWYGDMRIGDDSLTWCAADTSTQQFLQFDLIFSHRITEISVSGRTADLDTFQQLNDSWVSRYRLQYREEMGDWKYYEYSGTIVEIQGNSGIKTAVSHAINTSLIARYIRILPVQWENWICIRVELRGCKVKDIALEMENGNTEILYDSILGDGTNFPALLGTPSNSWISQYATNPQGRPFLQIGFVTISKHITSFATAVVSDERTWSFYLSYTEEGHVWTNYTENGVLKIFEGNRNKHLVVKHNLRRSLTARAIRLNPITWRSKPAFKVELYGNEVCYEALGLESGLLPNSSFTSNAFIPGYEPWKARVNSPRPWCFISKTDRGLLYIDLLNLSDVTGIANQKDSYGYALEIKISYSLDNVLWRYYTGGNADNIPKVRGSKAEYFTLAEHRAVYV